MNTNLALTFFNEEINNFIIGFKVQQMKREEMTIQIHLVPTFCDFLTLSPLPLYTVLELNGHRLLLVVLKLKCILLHFFPRSIA